MTDQYEEERAAQRQEFLKRERRNLKPPHPKVAPKKAGKAAKSKPLTFEQQLGLTEQWLEQTFPHLFAADAYIPLDTLILRDLKEDYRNNALRKNYPKDLVIKAALCRYRESHGYLACLKLGSFRYNLKGQICGAVTLEEEESARKILDSLSRTPVKRAV